MKLVFRQINVENCTEPAGGELIVRPKHPEGRTSKRLAILAFREGMAAFCCSPSTIDAIVVNEDPTFDDMLAATFLMRLASGEELPSGCEAFARYAEIHREGLRPGGVPLELSIEGIFHAIRNIDGSNLRDPVIGAHFAAKWSQMVEQILVAAEKSLDPFTTALFQNDHLFARERAYLAKDHDVYRNDVRAGEQWLVSLPGGPLQSPALVLRNPKSLLFKEWFREDHVTPTGEPYQFLAVDWGGGNWVFSTDPVQRISLKNLADLLQKAESAVNVSGAKNAPWFDGAPFAHTLIAAPMGGSALADRQILSIVKKWTRKKSVSGRDQQLLKRVLLTIGVFGIFIVVYLLFVAPLETSKIRVSRVVQPDEGHQQGVAVTFNDRQIDRGIMFIEESDNNPIASVELDVSLAPGWNSITLHSQQRVGQPVKVSASCKPDVQLPIEAKLQINNEREQSLTVREAHEQELRFTEVSSYFRADENQIVLRLHNRSQQSPPATVRFAWKADLTARRDLYLLAVGVSSYVHAELNLPCPRDDARALVDAFAAQTGQSKLFRQLMTDPELEPKYKALTDEYATKANLLRQLKWLRENAGSQSIVVVSLSGHGLKAENDRYFFLTHDYDPDQEPAATSLPWEDLLQYIRGMSCPVIVLVDTCHSGAIVVDGFASRNPMDDLNRVIETATKQLNESKNGIIVMAACLSDKQASESVNWGHGALTLAILEALKGVKSDNKDSRVQLPQGMVITMEDVRRYAEDRVRELVRTGQAVIVKSTEGMYLRNIPVAVR